MILTVHVPFVLILNKGVPSRFTGLLALDQDDLFDRTVNLELTAQLRLRRVIVLKLNV